MTEEQAAAQLRIEVDKKLGRETPEVVYAIARTESENTEMSKLTCTKHDNRVHVWWDQRNDRIKVEHRKDASPCSSDTFTLAGKTFTATQIVTGH